jgi:predicted outer membrane repeat protein
MYVRLVSIVTVSVLAVSLQTTSADLILVPNDYPTIQEAIDAAQDDDEIAVAPGTYPEAIDFLGKAIWLHSSSGPEMTTIDGNGALHVVQCVNGEGPTTKLEGFTISGGNAYGSGDNGYGGGMLNVSASPTVIDCIFEWNAADYGGGMLNRTGSSPWIENCAFENNTATTYGGGIENYDDANPTITDCTFAENAADYGGGMLNHTSSSPSVFNCLFESNAATDYGGGMENYDHSSPTLTSCTFIDNDAEYGGGLLNSTTSSPSITNCLFEGNTATLRGGAIDNYVSSSPTLTNCTFTGNTATELGGAIYNYYDSDPTVTNCILWGDTPDEIANVDFCDPIVTWCDVQGGHAGEGNIDAHPLFVNPTVGDRRLHRFSPCVDAGMNDAVPPEVTTDLDGNPRFVDDTGVPDSGSGTPPIVDMGAYERQEDSVNVTVTVPKNFTKIQEAILSCVDGDEIIVAPDTYFEVIDFLGREIRLHSSDGAAVTTIDGAGAYHIVQCVNGEGPNAILEGFTITGGAAHGSGDDAHGGGMLNVSSSPTVLDCIFTGNTAGYGAGMANSMGSSPSVSNCVFENNSATVYGGGMENYDSSDPTITDCTFAENTAGYGGGMRNSTESSPSITNCLFEGNAATIYGGGLENYNHSHPTLTNCSFTGNTATTYGGGIYNSLFSNPAVTNCILWGDAPNEIAGFFGSVPIVTWCDVQGGYIGEGNIDAYPLFVDPVEGDLRLYRFSPCIDAGTNAAVPPDVTTDLNGNPRFVDDAGVADTGWGTPPIVDMGAYERQEDSAGPSTVTVPGDFQTIQEAILYCIDGDEIIVAPGTYVETIDFAGREIWLHSSDGAAITTINGADAHHVVQCVNGEGPGAILEGFTITGGAADGSGDDGYGGGMLNVSASPTVLDCIFSGNTANFGGGMLNSTGSSPSITNCLFEGNVAWFRGGAIDNYISCSPVLTNCTFNDNTAGVLGGGIYNYDDSNPTITNCVLWGDAPDEIVNVDSSVPIVAWCDVQGGYDGEGNIDADPYFADPAGGDCRIAPGSPCIDAGDNAAVPPEVATDLAGLPRFVDDPVMPDGGAGDPPMVDLGAYEFQAGVTGMFVGPATTFVSEGPDGGPFLPETATYRVCNYGPEAITFSVAHEAEWLDVSPLDGSIPFGGHVDIVFAIDADVADDLPSGAYADAISFTNETTHEGDCTRNALLVVGEPWPVITFDFDADPGWSVEGEWAFGQPLGQGGEEHGYPDPTSGFTGDNVYGINLAGDYSTAIGGPYYLTTGPIDCSDLLHVQLHFERWLNSDYIPYVNAAIEVSNDGVDWVEIWHNWSNSPIVDSTWVHCAFDISAIADGQPAVRIRWSHEVALSDPYPYSGWNIDDVSIWGIAPASPPCPADVNGDGSVNVFDLLQLLSAWGDCPDCPEDLNDDDVVNVFDLLMLLGEWGDCD